MKSKTVAIILGAVVAAAIDAIAAHNNTTFGFLASGYTQALWGTTSSFAQPGAILGGVVVLQNGDVIAAECVTSGGTRLHRFQAGNTYQTNGTTLHGGPNNTTEIILPNVGTIADGAL